jgi:putative colanic acid biosynthesis acetyltransferase WcaF
MPSGSPADCHVIPDRTQMSKISLASYNNSWYSPGGRLWVQAVWFFAGLPLLRCYLLPFSGIRCALLRAFGAQIGRGVVIKPGVRVKYPWRLRVGNDSWLGEDCWIDNLGDVNIGADVCVSQAAHLCTGNHDRHDPAFGLIVKPIMLRDGSWVGAKSLICPGVELGEGAIATAGSVVTHTIPAWEIHGGNPAKLIKRRLLLGGQADHLACAATV